MRTLQTYPSLCPCGTSPASLIEESMGDGLLRCRHCGLLARTEMPSPEELTAWYRDQYWTRYRQEQVGSARDNIYRHAADWLDQLRPSRGMLVDVGCGGGAFLSLCRERGWRGVGFDPSPDAVAAATAMGLETYVHSWPPCPLDEGEADAVTFINVLDHLPDPFGALREAWRILRPGGLLYLRVPNGPLHARLMSLLAGIGLGNLPVIHLFGFGRAALLHHLSRLAFTVITLRTALPSQTDPYGSVSGGRVPLRRFLKRTDQMVYRLLAGLGLDRRGWGLSLEVMASKGEP